MALTPIAWAIATHAEAHALHLAARRGPALAARRAGTPASSRTGRHGRHGSDRRPRRSLPHRGRVVFGLAVGNHSLTLLLAIPVGLYVLAVDPGIWRRGRLVLSCVAVLVATVDRRLPGAAAAGRAVPGAARLRHARHAGRASGTSCSPSSSRAACRTRSAICRASSGSSWTGRSRSSGSSRPLVPIAFVVTVLRRPTVRAADGYGGGRSPASSPRPTSTPTSAATTSGRPSWPGPGWRSWPAPRSTLARLGRPLRPSRGPTARRPPATAPRRAGRGPG